MSDPFLQQQMNNAVNTDQAHGAADRRLDRLRDDVGSAQPGGFEATVWVCRLVGGFVMVAGVATGITMFKTAPFWVALAVVVGALAGGGWLIHWGEGARERRRVARLRQQNR